MPGWLDRLVETLDIILLAFVLRRGRANEGELPEESQRLEPERNRKMERSVKIGVGITAANIVENKVFNKISRRSTMRSGWEFFEV